MNLVLLLTSLFFINIVHAQKKAGEIDNQIRKLPEYKKLNKTYYIAVVPIQSCFSCVVMLKNEIDAASKSNDVIVIYPNARKIVKEKIIKDNNLNKQRVSYIFDTPTYDNLYDKKQPKGYVSKITKN